MRVKRVRTAGLVLMLCITVSGAAASRIIETDSFREISNHVEMLSEMYGPEWVLLVFDVDNTLLAPDQPLGSAQWFTWQESLVTAEPASHMRPENIDELLRIQGIIFSLGSMHLTEDTIPRLLEQWQEEGHYCMAFTDREQNFNDATQRELREAGLDFSVNPPLAIPEFCGVHMPYLQDNTGAAGLSRWESIDFEMETPREVRYERGVFMVAGQNKGAMLLIFLAHCTRYFPAVVFVDDNRANAEDVYTALNDRGIEITAFRYGEEDMVVEAFDSLQKEQAALQLEELQSVIRSVFATPSQ